jgi:aminoglycoside phosphotransferase family enzyme
MFTNEHKEVVAKETISIGEKVAFLKQPGIYPYPVTEVKVKETHMSWVFMAGDFVYKLKKPVQYSYFDHRTLESRFINSREEILINKLLAEEIYIGMVPLVITENGNLQLEGSGEIADWLVKMKRIAEENMLDYNIRHNTVDEVQLHKAAELLADFYKASAPVQISPEQFIMKLESEIFFNEEQLANPLFELPRILLKELMAGQLAFLSGHQSLIEERVLDKKIMDAHGDLRPEHICLEPQPAIIDRLEFCKDLRVMDTAEELSFLTMECDMLGNSHAGHVFFKVYQGITHDNVPRSLINFYKIKKACLRAFLVARHAAEPQYKEDPQWLAKANAYLQLAENYHQQMAE